jgi:hypothetical protein
MSAHIPDYRRAIHGRTWAETWRPEAVEHHRRSARHDWREWLRAGLFMGFIFGALFGFHAVAVYFGA